MTKKSSTTTHTSVSFPIARHAQAVAQAIARGYKIGNGSRSQIGDYLQHLLDEDAKRIEREQTRAAKRVVVES